MLGGLVFGFYAIISPPATHAPRDNVLYLSKAEADRLSGEFVAIWGRPPTDAEARKLIRDWMIETAMVREARSLGLDQDDAVIRNRLRSKMDFLAEAPAAAMTPGEDALEAYYAGNAMRYAIPARLGFMQVMLPADATQAEIDALHEKLAQGAEPSLLGGQTLLPQRIDDMTVTAVEQMFGGGFGDAVAAAPLHRWSGPLQSGYGRHLVRLEKLLAPQQPSLDTLRDEVLADWRADEARKMREAFTENLLKRYTLESQYPEEESDR